MRNTYFLLGALLLSASAFASNGKLPLQHSKQMGSLLAEITACCTQTSSTGTPNTAGYISVTVKKCHGGQTHEDARVAACGNAKLAADNSVKQLAISTVVIMPTP